MPSHEEELERERFIEMSQGVAQDAFGGYWRWSTYGHGSIPAWHPAMIGRSKGKPRDFGQDLRNGVIFLALVFGIPAIALFVPGGAKLPATLSYAVSIVMWIALGLAVAKVRAQRAALHEHHFPHPGEKGHHHHTSD